MPADGDEGVPTDVVPWAVGAQVRLEDSDGVVVSTRRELLTNGTALCIWSQELVPEVPLRPNSVYSIVAEPSEYAYDDGSPAVISFTTGDGLLKAEPPEAPVVRMAVFDATEYLNSCVYSQFQACLYTDQEGMLEVRVAGPNDERRFLGSASRLENLLLGNGAGDTCVEVRARDLAGGLSEPAVHCANTESLPLLAQEDSTSWAVDCGSSEVMALIDEDSQPEESDDTVGDPKDDPEEDDPDSGDVSDPDSGDVSDPDSGDVSGPDSGDVSDPDSGDVSDPDSGDVSDPDSGDVSDPDSGDVSDPDSGDASERDSGDLSDPGSTGVKAGSVCSMGALGRNGRGGAPILVAAGLLLWRRRRGRLSSGEIEAGDSHR
jgi:hypothetical protein